MFGLMMLFGVGILAGLAIHDTLDDELGEKAMDTSIENDDVPGSHSHHSLLDAVEEGSLSFENYKLKFGTAENDILSGGQDDDLIAGASGSDSIEGAGGDDLLVAFEDGSDSLFGGDGDDLVLGFNLRTLSDGQTLLDEDHTQDQVFGGFGDDAISLGEFDVAEGGDGSDTFVCSWDISEEGVIEISDFDPSLDKLCIQLSTMDFNLLPIEDSYSEFEISSTPNENGDGTTIELNGNSLVNLIGVNQIDCSTIEIKFG